MMPQATTRNVIFLCTGNSARSILAESILQKDGAGKFRAFSAGSQPKGQVNPYALQVLKVLGYPSTGFSSKSWDEFANNGGPTMDLVITVCDNAAGETCPIWPGHPSTAHWGIEDPAAIIGTESEKLFAFREAARLMKLRIAKLVDLSWSTLDSSEIKKRLDTIGRMEGATHGTV